MKRFTLEEIEEEQFYQMPKFLFNDKYIDLSSDARVLYSLLRDRHKLSAKNKWVNSNNEVYLIYTRTEMSYMLRVSNKTVLKAINQLKKHNLFEETQQGINRPNLIYIAHVDVENTLTCSYSPSRHGDITHQDRENLHGSKTYPIKTYNNKTEKRYIILADEDYSYIQIFKEAFTNRFDKLHKSVTANNLILVKQWCKDLANSGVEYDIFKEIVEEYLDELDTDTKGNILYFMSISMRMLGVNSPKYEAQ